MSKVKIIYGTGGGNTEVVCVKVAHVLMNAGHEVALLKAKSTEPDDIGDFDLLILASPTYGHGVLEKYMDVFVKKCKKLDLKGKPCAVIGLGDPRYDSDYHIESAKILTDFLNEKEAEIAVMALRVSRSPFRLLENHVKMWAEKVAGLLEK